MFDGLLGDELAHAVVDATTGQNDLRVVAQHFGLVGQVVRVHANAVAAHQTGLEFQEVPLGAGRLQHFRGVDAEFVENDGEFVHQCDVQVALGILDHLGGLRCLDAGGAVHTRHDDTFVQLRHFFQRFGRVARDDFQNPGQRMFFVTRVDALRRITHKEVLLPGHAGFALQHRNTNLFGGARINGGFVDHGDALFHVPADAGTGANERAKIRDVGVVDRCWYGHDDHVGFRQQAGVRGVHRMGRRPHVVVRQFA